MFFNYHSDILQLIIFICFILTFYSIVFFEFLIQGFCVNLYLSFVYIIFQSVFFHVWNYVFNFFYLFFLFLFRKITENRRNMNQNMKSEKY